MPKYEYICQNCSAQFAVERPMMRWRDQAVCPSCHSLDVRRRFSLPNLHLNSSSGRKSIEQVVADDESQTPERDPVGAGVYMENVTSENNGGAGIWVENVNITGRRIRLSGNEEGGLVARNAHVNMEDLEVD